MSIVPLSASALAVLQILQEDKVLSLADLRLKSGLSKRTMYGITSLLREQGLVKRVPSIRRDMRRVSYAYTGGAA